MIYVIQYNRVYPVTLESPMRAYTGLIFFLAGLFSAASCHKAGTGGKATLVIFPIHHDVPVVSKSYYRDSVFLFFNTKDLPVDPVNHADIVFTGETGEDHIHCENLHTGNYFVYVTAWDTLHRVRVTGGMAVTIKFKERKQEIDVKIPLTE